MVKDVCLFALSGIDILESGVPGWGSAPVATSADHPGKCMGPQSTRLMLGPGMGEVLPLFPYAHPENNNER